MSRLGIALSLPLLLAGTPASVAGSPVHAVAVSGGGVEKRFEGRVTEVVAGRSLTIELDDRSLRTFALDEKDVETTVTPGLAAGARVRVVESRSADGKRPISVAFVLPLNRKP